MDNIYSYFCNLYWYYPGIYVIQISDKFKKAVVERNSQKIINIFDEYLKGPPKLVHKFMWFIKSKIMRKIHAKHPDNKLSFFESIAFKIKFNPHNKHKIYISNVSFNDEDMIFLCNILISYTSNYIILNVTNDKLLHEKFKVFFKGILPDHIQYVLKNDDPMLQKFLNQ